MATTGKLLILLGAAVLMLPGRAEAQTAFYMYQADHPMPLSQSEDGELVWCEEEGEHLHPFAPDPEEEYLYQLSDGIYQYVGPEDGDETEVVEEEVILVEEDLDSEYDEIWIEEDPYPVQTTVYVGWGWSSWAYNPVVWMLSPFYYVGWHSHYWHSHYWHDPYWYRPAYYGYSPYYRPYRSGLGVAPYYAGRYRSPYGYKGWNRPGYHKGNPHYRKYFANKGRRDQARYRAQHPGHNGYKGAGKHTAGNHNGYKHPGYKKGNYQANKSGSWSHGKTVPASSVRYGNHNRPVASSAKAVGHSNRPGKTVSAKSSARTGKSVWDMPRNTSHNRTGDRRGTSKASQSRTKPHKQSTASRPGSSRRGSEFGSSNSGSGHKPASSSSYSGKTRSAPREARRSTPTSTGSSFGNHSSSRSNSFSNSSGFNRSTRRSSGSEVGSSKKRSNSSKKSTSSVSKSRGSRSSGISRPSGGSRSSGSRPSGGGSRGHGGRR